MESEQLHGERQYDPFVDFLDALIKVFSAFSPALAQLAKVFSAFQGALTQLAKVSSALLFSLIAFLVLLIEIMRQLHGRQFDPFVGRERRGQFGSFVERGRFVQATPLSWREQQERPNRLEFYFKMVREASTQLVVAFFTLFTELAQLGKAFFALLAELAQLGEIFFALLIDLGHFLEAATVLEGHV